MFSSLPPATRAILLANLAVFAAEMLLGTPFIEAFALWPLGPEFAPWQLVTYGFLHGSLLHLGTNMLGLYMFGSDLERVWGSRRFTSYYMVCVLSAAATQIVVTASTGSELPTLGASGAVFGLLLAFARHFPRRIIVLLIPPIPMPAWLFATLYGALTLYLGLTGSDAGVAHFAHLGGMLGGWLMLRHRTQAR